MLFVCDIGNSSIRTGVFNGDKLLFSSVFSSKDHRTTDDMAVLISGAFAMHGIDISNVDGAVIASVVRPNTSSVMAAIELLMGIKPLVVGPGVKSGLNIKTDIPSQLGADIVACAVGAQLMEPRPQVIAALGTAVTLAGINNQNELCGVIIAPGIGISMEALSEHAAELPRAGLDCPRCLLGQNTVDSMNSGIVYGYASMLDGLLDRIASEWGQDGVEVIATGAYAEIVIPHMVSRHRIRYDADLSLNGLKQIYKLNRKRQNH